MSGRILFASFLLVSCVSRIVPPAHPEDPCQVFLLKDGIHRGILVPDSQRGYVEWGYGDWDWYALLANRWYNVFDTVLWPTQGCLGRKPWSEGEAKDGARRGTLVPFWIGSGEARALLGELEERFQENGATRIWNDLYEMEFVQDPEGFWFLHNCNDEVAEWLERVGCRVGWVPVRLDLRLAIPVAGAPSSPGRVVRSRAR